MRYVTAQQDVLSIAAVCDLLLDESLLATRTQYGQSRLWKCLEHLPHGFDLPWNIVLRLQPANRDQGPVVSGKESGKRLRQMLGHLGQRHGMRQYQPRARTRHAQSHKKLDH